MGNFHIFTFLAVISLALTNGADNLLETIFFRLYKNDTHKDINIGNITLLIPELNLDKLTVFYIHGFSESVESESVKLVTNAYLTSTDFNVVAIDYSKIAAENYLVAVGYVGAVAQTIGGALNKLEENGLDQNKIHIVGHSLGGQVSGQVGQVTKFRVPKMIGLDPAGPFFYTGRYMRSGDAKFVQIIHTDRFNYGNPYNTGDVNFLPNFGHRLQPGCPPAIPLTFEEFCSHHRSWRFYAESVKNPDGFLGIQCNDDLAFQLGLCNHTNVVPMGFDTPTTAGTSPNINHIDDVNINHIANLFPKLNVNEQTVFYIHGYGENVDSQSVNVIVQAYLKYTTKNIIAIDYRQIADNKNYIVDVERVKNVGTAIADALSTLVAAGLDPNSVHIIGHSLGGQVAAFVGSHTKFRVPRITGLDPAGPLFYTGRYLKAGDAEFVDIIHTDEGLLGQVEHSGDVDLLPNGGHTPQPGCPVMPISIGSEINCNHRRSWRYYAESVGNPQGFLAVQCKCGIPFIKKQCDPSNIIPMGYATPSTARGTYNLDTNSQSPYALGKSGLTKFISLF